MTERPSLTREIFAATVVGALGIAVLYLVVAFLSTGLGMLLVIITLAGMGRRRYYRIRIMRPHLPRMGINVISRRHFRFWR